MGAMLISPEIRYRDTSGRFLAACDEAGAMAVKTAGEEGVTIAKRLAPVGGYPDDRGPTIIGGLDFYMTGAMSGVIASRARHSLPQEKGAGAHAIGGDGQVLANPPKGFGPVRGPVAHPGNAAQPFLAPTYAILRKKLISIMARFYPS